MKFTVTDSIQTSCLQITITGRWTMKFRTMNKKTFKSVTHLSGKHQNHFKVEVCHFLTTWHQPMAWFGGGTICLTDQWQVFRKALITFAVAFDAVSSRRTWWIYRTMFVFYRICFILWNNWLKRRTRQSTVT